MDEQDEVAMSCLDMLRGASGLLARHKAEVGRLLPRRDERERGALERLVSDLTEVLSRGSTSSGGGGSGQQEADEAVEREQGQEQEEEAVSDSEAAARRGVGGESGMKRAKAQQAVQAGRGQQQVGGASPAASPAAVAACEGGDPLAIPEVLERVMSFAEDWELLWRHRVCRLWRRVLEGEGLSLRLVERRMPSALVGGEESVHARLGGSARRFLVAHEASMTGGRLICGAQLLHEMEELVLLVEVFYNDTALCVASGDLNLMYWEQDQDIEQCLVVEMKDGVFFNKTMESYPFSPASLGLRAVQDITKDDSLWVRFCVADVGTGVTASLYQGPFWHNGERREPKGPHARLDYTSERVPVTSMTYAGPPLEVELAISIGLCEEVDEGEAGLAATQNERLWRFLGCPELEFKGQSPIYGERFIRTRLAEEAMAAKQHGSR